MSHSRTRSVKVDRSVDEGNHPLPDRGHGDPDDPVFASLAASKGDLGEGPSSMVDLGRKEHQAGRSDGFGVMAVDLWLSGRRDGLVGLCEWVEGSQELPLEDGEQREDHPTDDAVELLDDGLEGVSDKPRERLCSDGRSARELLAERMPGLESGVSERETVGLARVEGRRLGGGGRGPDRVRGSGGEQDRVRERRVDKSRKEDGLEARGAVGGRRGASAPPAKR